MHLLHKCPVVHAEYIIAKDAVSWSLGGQTQMGPCESHRRFTSTCGKPRATRQPPSPQQPLRDWSPVTHPSLLSIGALQAAVAATVAEPSASGLGPTLLHAWPRSGAEQALQLPSGVWCFHRQLGLSGLGEHGLVGTPEGAEG